MSDPVQTPIVAHIVLAEDDGAMRAFLTRALETAGYSVAAFTDGLSAHDHLNNPANPATLLLTDIVMPGMDGIELATRALQARPGIKIMYITGFGTVAQNRVDDGTPDAQVLAKPLHLGQLIDEVARVLATP